ncbi:MAG TPA: hypothetical protein VGF64_02145 [Acidimicrobiales bacterium]
MTQSALAEVLGNEFAKIADTGRVPSWLRPLVTEARRVSSTRRER